jgi:hypothetical protein
MGMDVYGVGNKEAYFRANIWSWKPIHFLISKFAADLVDENTIKLMEFNDGAGISNTDDCIKLANRIENWMEHNVNGLQVELTQEMNQNIEQMMSNIISMMPNEFKEGAELKYGNGNEPKFKVNDEHLKEFVEFLRVCKGFKVL